MSSKELSARVWQDPVYFVAFGFGSGLLPMAPGTWGTLAAVPLYLLLSGISPVLYLMAVILIGALGVCVSQIVSRDLQHPDFGGIVIDEITGYLFTLFLAPVGLMWMLTGFLLFRLFDIWKPWPIGAVEKSLPGGWGVMLDDVLAAIPACLILQLLAWMIQG